MARFLTLLFVCAIAVASVMAAPSKPKVNVAKDLTSALSEIFGYTDGRKVYTRCPVGGNVPKTYTSNSPGACSPNKALCGKQIYAYIGSGSGPLHVSPTIIDICARKNITANELDFTLTSFKQLGGTVAQGNLTNVNYKFL